MTRGLCDVTQERRKQQGYIYIVVKNSSIIYHDFNVGTSVGTLHKQLFLKPEFHYLTQCFPLCIKSHYKISIGKGGLQNFAKKKKFFLKKNKKRKE